MSSPIVVGPSNGQGYELVPGAGLPFPPHRYGTPSASWVYRDAEGTPTFVICRFEISGGGKAVMPLTPIQTNDGVIWVWQGLPAPRPLYGLDRLAGRLDAPVLLVEGEKTAEAAAALLPEFVIVTTVGGCGQVNSAEYGPLALRDVVIWPDADDAGSLYGNHVASAAARAGAASVRLVSLPAGLPTGWDLADPLPADLDITKLLTMAAPFVPPPKTGPHSLFRELSAAEPFPVGVLPPLLEGAVEGVCDAAQCPQALAAQSVIATAALIAQAHCDVMLPTGEARPTSLFLVSIAASGERKSTADNLAGKSIISYEAKLRDTAETSRMVYANDSAAWEKRRKAIINDGKLDRVGTVAALAALGAAPQAPIEPMLTPGEPTAEGLTRLLASGPGYAGVFSSEGGQFLGGHAMNADNKLKTAAMLSILWDGSVLKRVRGGDGVLTYPGRRASLHLMVQPGIGAALMSDALLVDQGLLSRVLVAAPPTNAGLRMWHEMDPAKQASLARFHDAATARLNRPLPLKPSTTNELVPNVLHLDQDARSQWIAFHDWCEASLGKDGTLVPIRGFANKLPEQAARLAAVFAFWRAPDTGSVSATDMAGGIEVARWYAGEALRLLDAGLVNPDLYAAERVRKWLVEMYLPTKGAVITLSALYQYGPRGIRTKANALRVVEILEDHGWLKSISLEDGVRGQAFGRAVQRESWTIVHGKVA